MIQLDFLTGTLAGDHCVARHFPFRVGRKPASDLVLQADGVWDEHLRLRIEAGAVVMDVLPGARVFVNDEPVETVPLAAGDVITLGAVQMRFGLAPSTQRSLKLRETVAWLLLPFVFAAQLGMIAWLLSM